MIIFGVKIYYKVYMNECRPCSISSNPSSAAVFIVALNKFKGNWV